MNILVTLNSNYLMPLCTMLRSLVKSNGSEKIDLYVAHSSLTESDFEKINLAIQGGNINVIDIKLDDDLFADAPFKKRISKETYYRMFAPFYLPESVDRILYIDPDTVVINSLEEFYNLDFGDFYIIGAKHFDGFVGVWNKARLGIHRSKHYINAGVMLMDIKKMRLTVDKKKIFKVIHKYNRILFLADQDAINILYDGKITTFTEFKINLDERTFAHMLEKIEVNQALDIVRDMTAIVHFNGKNKPWKSKYKGYLSGFYDKYNQESPDLNTRGTQL